jgi:hypothetical protein
MKQFVILLSFVLVLASCHRDTTYTESKVNNRYIISIPDYMKPSYFLHKDASFQCADTTKDIYAVVMDEKKKTLESYAMHFTLETYFTNITKQPFLKTIKNGKITSPVKDTISGNNTLLAEITGSVKNTEVYYRLAVIESPTAFYQVVVWTKADKKDEMLPEMNKIIHSFKELPLAKEEQPQENKQAN